MNPNFISIEGLVLPNEPLLNIQLISAVKRLRIKNFKGIFVRYKLPEKQSRNAVWYIEFGQLFGTWHALVCLVQER